MREIYLKDLIKEMSLKLAEDIVNEDEKVISIAPAFGVPEHLKDVIRSLYHE